MSSLRGGFQRPGELAVNRAHADEAYESHDDDPVVNHGENTNMLSVDPQGDLAGGLATPCVAEPF